MTFTIEPMVNEGQRHTRLMPDGWTVVTKDRIAVGAVGAHRRGDRQRRRDPDPRAGRRQRPVSAPAPADYAGLAPCAGERRRGLAGDGEGRAGRAPMRRCSGAFAGRRTVDRLIGKRCALIDTLVRDGLAALHRRRSAMTPARDRRLRPRRIVSRIPTSTCWCWPSRACSSKHEPALARFFALLWDAGLADRACGALGRRNARTPRATTSPC